MLTLEPQFFDIFGALTFIYIVAFSLLGIFNKKISKWMYFALLLIGLAGLLIDGIIVYNFYIK